MTIISFPQQRWKECGRGEDERGHLSILHCLKGRRNSKKSVEISKNFKWLGSVDPNTRLLPVGTWHTKTKESNTTDQIPVAVKEGDVLVCNVGDILKSIISSRLCYIELLK
jgi:hypothetical protein